MSLPPGARARRVRVAAVPAGVAGGTLRVTVPLAQPAPSRGRRSGKSEAKPRSLVAWKVKCPPEPLDSSLKGTEKVSPGSMRPPPDEV